MRIRALETLALAFVTASVLVTPSRVDFSAVQAAAREQAATASPPDGDDAAVPILPKRRAPAQSPAPPPPLPSGADRVTPLTLEATIRRQTAAGPGYTRRQTITRTAERIHVAPSEGPEWLFERNPVDSRRVSGFLIDHASRAIVFHSDTDLRNVFAIPGWAYALTLGFDPSLLTGLEPSAEVRTIGGIRFTRFSRANQTGEPLDIWWNEQELLPGEFATSDDTGRTQFSIESIRIAADQTVLGPPASRFREYRSVDLADWLEHR
jgi:hypothetical protein